MKMNHIKKQRKLSIILVLAVIVSCFAGVGNANKAEAAVTSSGIIYDGNGSTSKNLLNGKVANVDVVNSADTDRAILENATDMAALLATSKGFISNLVEFDVVSKGYQITK